MTALTCRWATLLALVIACVLPLGSAQAASTENVATAVTEQDSSHVFDFAWDVSRQRGVDDVDHLNQATARARCFRCGATAIAFQIVLVTGSPTTIVPRNYGGGDQPGVHRVRRRSPRPGSSYGCSRSRSASRARASDPG